MGCIGVVMDGKRASDISFIFHVVNSATGSMPIIVTMPDRRADLERIGDLIKMKLSMKNS